MRIFLKTFGGHEKITAILLHPFHPPHLLDIRNYQTIKSIKIESQQFSHSLNFHYKSPPPVPICLMIKGIPKKYVPKIYIINLDRI